MIVDEMHEEHPELLKDQYWDEVVPKDLPYTVASEHYRREEPKGSAECYKVKESDSLYANMAPGPGHHMHRKTVAPEDMYADYVRYNARLLLLLLAIVVAITAVVDRNYNDNCSRRQNYTPFSFAHVRNTFSVFWIRMRAGFTLTWFLTSFTPGERCLLSGS